MAHPRRERLPGDVRAARGLLQPAALLRAGAARRVGQVGSLRVATYNIRSAIGPGPFPDRWWSHVDSDRLEAIAAVIAALDADVVALQEIALLNLDGRLHDQASLLALMTEMQVRFGAVRHFPIPDEHYAEPAIGSGLFGNAILTRLPVRSSRVIALPQAPAMAAIEPIDSGHALAGVRYVDVDRPVREPRCALIVEVTLPDGRDLSVASVHFSHIGSRERELQSIALVEGLAGPGPAVVLGDLNAPIERPELAPLVAAFDDAFEQVGVPRRDERRLTMDERDARIDHILLREAIAAGCRVAREAGDASDHWPVLATINA